MTLFSFRKRLKSIHLILVTTILSGPFSVANKAMADELTIYSQPIDYFHLASSDDRVGKLRFVGGLVLTSNDERFGGLSGLRLSADGQRFYSVSDKAFWLTAEIKRNGKGRLNSIVNGQIDCLCRTNGKPYNSKHWADAEAVEISNGYGLVSFERLNRINRYKLDANKLPGKPAQATPSFKRLNIEYNQGLEALARAPEKSHLAGRLIAIGEESLNKAGNHRAFIASKKTIREFSITNSDAYAITDAVFSPDGNLLILERRFGVAVGLGMRIRQIDGSKIKPGAVLTGSVLAEASLMSRIDNMEGIASWKDPAGNTRIALISDDNYNKRLQNTLLLEFILNQ